MARVETFEVRPVADSPVEQRVAAEWTLSAVAPPRGGDDTPDFGPETVEPFDEEGRGRGVPLDAETVSVEPNTARISGQFKTNVGCRHIVLGRPEGGDRMEL